MPKMLVAVAASAVAASAALAVWWLDSERLRTTGDEPHYLIVAASVLRDADLDVRNNYEEDARTAEIYGPVPPHVTVRDSGTWPSHAPGLGILLAIPMALGGPVGARAALCLLAGLLAWSVWWWFRDRLPPGDTALLTAGLLCGPTVLFGVSQIYPDLAGGIAVAALAVWLWAPRQSARTLAGWCAYWLCTGLLWWLHVKYLAPAAVLAAAAAWQIRCDRAGGYDSRPLSAHLAAAALVLAGPLTLGWWHAVAFGNVLGPRGLADLASPWLQRVQVFTGLHLDQGQGMFLQQPLLLPGLAALGYMLRRRHRLTLPWLLLYGSLILPNALQWSGRFGGAGPAGRFGWSAMWLWAIPIGIWIVAERDTIARYVRPVILAGLAYQAALAVRWLPEPAGLISRQSELIWARHSLFPVSARYSLPSFYFWDSADYLGYLPNVVWMAAALLLLATGFLWTSAAARTTLRSIWLAGALLAALLLPVEPTADSESPTDDALHDRLERAIRSEIPRRFEAERMTPMSLAEGTTRTDSRASGGRARSSTPIRSDRFLAFGPYLSLDRGRYRAEVALRLAAATSVEIVARFEVATERGRSIVAAMDVPAARLPFDGTYARAAITFETAERLRDVEFRLVAYPGVDLLVDYVDLIPVLPQPGAPQPETILELPPALR